MKRKSNVKRFREIYGRRVKERYWYNGSSKEDVTRISKLMGYSQADIDAVPEGSNLGLGCGNPIAHAAIQEGERVLDLGSGAGMDCFIAADKVGITGKVIGVDMTHAMIHHARANAEKNNYRNVEFRQGEIEDLPINDGWADLIISNCTINLSPEKKTVFNEAFRTLKPGGRMVIADLVLKKELPDVIKTRFKDLIEGFIAIIPKAQYLDIINHAGFQDVTVVDETRYSAQLTDFDDPIVKAAIAELKLSEKQIKEVAPNAIEVVSITIRADKPHELAKDSLNHCSGPAGI
ncbi:MAG: arsenite methyltransferase [Candidatus Bathyarchaeota archaeon]|nr:MAG: arsenite methyltransferase [Candidatus Bathyarchaeota archaeon]